MKFLERESTPQPPQSTPKLPADRMIQEQEDRRRSRTLSNTYNPFSASVINPSVPSLVTAGGTGTVPTLMNIADRENEHPLMRPISPPHLPVFAAASSSSSSNTAAELLVTSDRSGGSVSGRSSVDNTSSGRSTPSTSSAILRDILQQR